MRKWLPLTAVTAGSFMLLIDVTIVYVALPDMASDLGTSFSSTQWVLTAYALALAALLLGAGGLADRVGRRFVYVGGLLLFAAASLAAGLAPSTDALIVARTAQGAAAAAMFATTIALINACYEGRDRGIAFGVWGAVNSAAASLGPIFGGLLTEGLSWRWIFFVNLPISVLAVALSLSVLPREERRREGRIDVAGIAAFTACAGLLTYALTRAPEVGWSATSTVLLLLGAALALGAFVLAEWRGRHPIIELALLRRPAFAGVLAAGLALSVSAFASLAYASIWLQSIQGMSPIDAGLVLVPLSLAAMVTALSVGRVLHATSPRLLISSGLALAGAGALAQANLSADSSWSALLAGQILVGIGAGLATPTLASAALLAVPEHRGGMAAGAVNTMRQIGLGLGIAVLGVLCQARMAGTLAEAGIAAPHDAARRLVAGQAEALLAEASPERRGAVDTALDTAFAAGFNRAEVVAGVVGLAGALLVALVVRPETKPTGQGA